LKPASTPPHSYGHPFQLAERYIAAKINLPLTHKTVYMIIPAVQRPSCLSPAAAASSHPPRFFHAEISAAGAGRVTIVETCFLRSYGFRFQRAKDTSPRGLTFHCTHKAAYFIFPAAQLQSRLSPAAAAFPRPPSSPVFFFRVLPVSRLFLQAER
jgi:hypothetical protein